MGGDGEGQTPVSDQSMPCGIMHGMLKKPMRFGDIWKSRKYFRKNCWPSNFHFFFQFMVFHGFPPFFPFFFPWFSTSSVGSPFPEARDAAAAIRWGQGGSHQGPRLRSAAADAWHTVATDDPWSYRLAILKTSTWIYMKYKEFILRRYQWYRNTPELWTFCRAKDAACSSNAQLTVAGCFLRSAGIKRLTPTSRSSLLAPSRVAGHVWLPAFVTFFVTKIPELLRPYQKICDSALDLIGFTPRHGSTWLDAEGSNWLMIIGDQKLANGESHNTFTTIPTKPTLRNSWGWCACRAWQSSSTKPQSCVEEQLVQSYGISQPVQDMRQCESNSNDLNGCWTFDFKDVDCEMVAKARISRSHLFFSSHVHVIPWLVS